jgi:hypothetical protein
MKLAKLKIQNDELTSFNKFVVALVITLACSQGYRQLWMAVDGAMSISPVYQEAWYKA